MRVHLLLTDGFTLKPLEFRVPDGLFPYDLAFQGFCVSRGLRLSRLFASQQFPQRGPLRLRQDAKLRLFTQSFLTELTVGQRPRVMGCDGQNAFKLLQGVAIGSTSQKSSDLNPMGLERLLLARLMIDLCSRRGR